MLIRIQIHSICPLSNLLKITV